MFNKFLCQQFPCELLKKPTGVEWTQKGKVSPCKYSLYVKGSNFQGIDNLFQLRELNMNVLDLMGQTQTVDATAAAGTGHFSGRHVPKPKP